MMATNLFVNVKDAVLKYETYQLVIFHLCDYSKTIIHSYNYIFTAFTDNFFVSGE